MVRFIDRVWPVTVSDEDEGQQVSWDNSASIVNEPECEFYLFFIIDRFELSSHYISCKLGVETILRVQLGYSTPINGYHFSNYFSILMGYIALP